jgi:hypothetical protein
MNLRRLLAFTLVVLGGPDPASGRSTPGVEKPSTVRLDRVELQLFYLGTGRLSENILDKANFAGWNVVIGAGDAEEPADDVLVTASLSSVDGGEKFIDAPAEMTVRSSKGKVLGLRRWSHFLVPKGGHVTLPLWVKDATCAGDLMVTARYNGTVKTGRVALVCGE